jgi:hypothetical protein
MSSFSSRAHAAPFLLFAVLALLASIHAGCTGGLLDPAPSSATPDGSSTIPPGAGGGGDDDDDGYYGGYYGNYGP